MSPLRVVAAVLVRDGRVLAAQRPAHKSQGGLWELPGGKVEPGETDAQALARELREELGVDVVVGAAVAEGLHPYPARPVLLVALRCSLAPGAEPVAHEHQALRWVDAPGLDGLAWAPADLPLLPAVRALLVPPPAGW